MKNPFLKLGGTSGLSAVLAILLITLFFTACQKTEKAPAQLVLALNHKNVTKQEVGKVTDLYFKYYSELNANALSNLLTEDCVTRGADPSEVWNKAIFIQKIKNLKDNPNSKTFTQNLNFDLIDRIIQLSNNGNTAIVTDLSKVNFSEMLIKKTTKLKKIETNWKINYVNTTLVAAGL